MSRAATFVFGATLAVAGCGTSTGPGTDVPTTDLGPADQGGPMPLYGAPVDASRDVTADEGGLIAMYGGPPPRDAGPDDDGSTMALYGDPVPPDVIQSDVPHDNGGVVPAYGLPPRDA